MFQQTLVPLDGSHRAEKALSVAARIARANNGTIVLLQVVSPLVGYSNGLTTAPLYRNDLIEKACTEARAYLKTVAQSEDLKGIHIRTQVHVGLPVERILEEIGSKGVGLTVLCSHGRTGFKRWALGSVAQRVIHHSPVPTLVLREQGASLPVIHVDSARPLSAIVSLDGSPLAEAVLISTANLVAALARPSQAQDVAEAIVTIAEEKLGSTEENSSDILAMATHGRGGLERWVMGSMTERVLNATTLPMLIIRPKPMKSE
jgi:nucleotide-binding universal stress UspA family protein